MKKSVSKRVKAPAQTQFSSRNANFNTGDLLRLNNIQGRRLRNAFTFDVKNVDTLRQLKKTISARNGLFVLCLYYRGVCLKDEWKLAHLLSGMLQINPPRFSVRTRLSTELSTGGDITLFVKGLKGSTFQVHLPALSNVAGLRAAIRDYECYSSEQDFNIMCAWKMLEEDMALTEYNLVHGPLVKVVGRLLGGDANHAPAPSQRFVDTENNLPSKP